LLIAAIRGVRFPATATATAVLAHAINETGLLGG